MLVQAAKNHFNNPKVQARVAGALRKLSANDENKHEIAEAGGIEMLIESSERPPRQRRRAGGRRGRHLQPLGRRRDRAADRVAQGGIEVLINAAKAHINNVKVQARVVRALTNLSVHDANKARIASTLGIVTLIAASFEHPESAEVQAGVAGALRNLSVSPQIAQLIVEKNAIQSLMQAAQIHASNAIVQAGVAGALRNLSVNEALNRKAIVRGGGMERSTMATQIHADNEKLQSEVTSIAREIASGARSSARREDTGCALPRAVCVCVCVCVCVLRRRAARSSWRPWAAREGRDSPVCRVAAKWRAAGSRLCRTAVCLQHRRGRRRARWMASVPKFVAPSARCAAKAASDGTNPKRGSTISGRRQTQCKLHARPCESAK